MRVANALDDASLRERVARCGAAVVDADFAPRTIAPALLAMYEAALAHGSRPERAPVTASAAASAAAPEGAPA